jgi:hypothetical protein
MQLSVLNDGNNVYDRQYPRNFIDTLQLTSTHICPTILKTSKKIKIINEAHHKGSWYSSNAHTQLYMRCSYIKGH